jgi:hypothetical protein
MSELLILAALIGADLNSLPFVTCTQLVLDILLQPARQNEQKFKPFFSSSHSFDMRRLAVQTKLDDKDMRKAVAYTHACS